MNLDKKIRKLEAAIDKFVVEVEHDRPFKVESWPYALVRNHMIEIRDAAIELPKILHAIEAMKKASEKIESEGIVICSPIARTALVKVGKF